MAIKLANQRNRPFKPISCVGILFDFFKNITSFILLNLNLSHFKRIHCLRLMFAFEMFEWDLNKIVVANGVHPFARHLKFSFDWEIKKWFHTDQINQFWNVFRNSDHCSWRSFFFFLSSSIIYLWKLKKKINTVKIKELKEKWFFFFSFARCHWL